MHQGFKTIGPFTLIGESGHEQDRQLRIVSRRVQGKSDAIHDRHLDVREQQVEGPFFASQRFHRFAAVLDRFDGMPVEFKGAFYKTANRFIVFGEKNVPCSLS